MRRHAVLLRDDGEVFTCGGNLDGQCRVGGSTCMETYKSFMGFGVWSTGRKHSGMLTQHPLLRLPQGEVIVTLTAVEEHHAMISISACLLSGEKACDMCVAEHESILS